MPPLRCSRLKLILDFLHQFDLRGDRVEPHVGWNAKSSLIGFFHRRLAHLHHRLHGVALNFLRRELHLLRSGGSFEDRDEHLLFGDGAVEARKASPVNLSRAKYAGEKGGALNAGLLLGMEIIDVRGHAF